MWAVGCGLWAVDCGRLWRATDGGDVSSQGRAGVSDSGGPESLPKREDSETDHLLLRSHVGWGPSDRARPQTILLDGPT